MNETEGKIYGYCRVSTLEQDTTMQEIAIKEKYPDAKMFTEKESGANNNRPVLDLLLKAIGKDDRLVVWKLDRLGRDTQKILDIVKQLEREGAGLVVMDMGGDTIDTKSAQGYLILTIFAGFAEFERRNSKERQRAGIERAKLEGKYTGRKAVDTAPIYELLDNGLSIRKTAIQLGISPATVQKAKNEREQKDS